MEQLYDKFVETWSAEFPQDDPPLLDLHGCILTSNDGFESVNTAHLGKLYNESRETAKRLKREYRKAELIENFWATFMKDCNGIDSAEYSSRSITKKISFPGSRTQDRKFSDESPSRKYSLLDGLGKCVDSSIETFVNVGLGEDVIDVTPNHEIQVNALVHKDKNLITDNKMSDVAPGENLVTEVLNNYSRDSGSLPSVRISDVPHSRDNSPYANARIVNDESKVSSDDDEIDYENQCMRKLSASTERVPSIKPAIPPRRPKSEHPTRPKPATVPRSKKLEQDSSPQSPQRSSGEPVKTKVNNGKHDHRRPSTPETNLDDLTGKYSSDNHETTSSSHAGISQSSEEANRNMFRKFRLSDGGKEKHNSGEVISTGFKHLSNDLDTFDANITESSQNSSPEPATNRSKKRLRSNDYENFSVDFLLRRTAEFDLEDEDERDNQSSDIYDNVTIVTKGTKKSSDSDTSSIDTVSNTSLTSGEGVDSKPSVSGLRKNEKLQKEYVEDSSSSKCKCQIYVNKI